MANFFPSNLYPNANRGTFISKEVSPTLNPNNSLNEINRCLKKQGFFLGSVPHPSVIWSLNELIHQKLSNKKLRKLLNKIHLISNQESYNVPFHMLYTLEQFHELISSFYILKNQLFAFGLWICFVAQKK